jgi:hypothetical protein
MQAYVVRMWAAGSSPWNPVTVKVALPAPCGQPLAAPDAVDGELPLGRQMGCSASVQGMLVGNTAHADLTVCLALTGSQWKDGHGSSCAHTTVRKVVGCCSNLNHVVGWKGNPPGGHRCGCGVCRNPFARGANRGCLIYCALRLLHHAAAVAWLGIVLGSEGPLSDRSIWHPCSRYDLTVAVLF